MPRAGRAEEEYDNMDRRSFLTASSGLAVTGAAAVALASKPAQAARTGAPTVFDFGAVGDGNTDDSGAFAKALSWAALNGGLVTVPPNTYAIANTIRWDSSQSTGVVWGLQGQGAILQSKITDGRELMYLNSSHTVRYFNMRGISVVGTQSDGSGIHIAALGPDVFFNNFLIDAISVERMGKDGIVYEGDVFEFTMSNSWFQDNKANGCTFAQSKNGIVSAVNVNGCFFNQNGNYGMACVNWDSQYGGPTDVRVYGGYARNNQSYGFYYNNGTGAGAGLTQVGFENNCMSKQPGDPEGAHVYGLTSIKMRDCFGYNQGGGATYLVRGWFNSPCLLDGCAQGADGAMGATGKSRLMQINGSNTAAVVLNSCGGGFDGVGGTGARWQAVNCTGPSPVGDLNPVGTMSGAL
jgi:Right handed beta helix region